MLDAAGYDALREEQATRRSNGDVRQLGIGLSTYVEITNGLAESEFGAVEITPAGEAIILTGSLTQGQGHETTFAQIASEQLGIPIEKISLIKGDTDAVARGTGTYGSKSTQIGGVAAGKASDELAETAKRLTAEELEANPEDMVLELGAGRFHVAGAPEPSLSWSDLAGRLDAAGRIAELSAEAGFRGPSGGRGGRHRAAVIRAGGDGDADTGQPTGREGDRRVGDDRRHARGSQRGPRRARSRRRQARRR